MIKTLVLIVLFLSFFWIFNHSETFSITNYLFNGVWGEKKILYIFLINGSIFTFISVGGVESSSSGFVGPAGLSAAGAGPAGSLAG